MTDTPDSRLRRLLGPPELADVRQRLRRHFERIEPDASTRSLRLTDLDPAAHSALCQLTGRRSRTARSMILDITELDERLRAAGLADSLRDALERMEGPIVAKTSMRRQLQARWSALATMNDGDSRLQAWLQAPAALTLLKRLGRDPGPAASLLADVDAVLRRLPATGLTRSQLAAETLGDAHALDAGRPVATLILAVWRHGEPAIDDRAADSGTGDEPAADEAGEERPRDIWARAGVLVNELARPALFLNLPPTTETAGAWMPGEPAWLSLRQLLRRPPAWRIPDRHIFVCENPDIVAIAADHLGASCAPLVCTDGMPAAAQRALLDQLLAAGAHLHYHGDHDWAGITIGNFVMRRWRARPWRFGAADYLAAVARTPVSRNHELTGAMVESDWDPQLAPAMHEHGLAIAEEAVVDTLLEDLGGTG